jgi:hypothetical protein
MRSLPDSPAQRPDMTAEASPSPIRWLETILICMRNSCEFSQEFLFPNTKGTGGSRFLSEELVMKKTSDVCKPKIG